MCFLLISYEQFTCGHQVVVKRQKVSCTKSNCARSSHHRTDPHDCLGECVREMAPDRPFVQSWPDQHCDVCYYGAFIKLDE
ncbi:hypothetical protein BDN72DRAFT_850517 [Pluteus cervinus]|uniref:Uncharacterized protein n=1 Tax=Pluteus cervinus TaxID=181527 RepID=A0ACD3A3N5_9AGAR|nr:hypothetical protein BDN72DRAFT_850517 [Pluteus cervinus]